MKMNGREGKGSGKGKAIISISLAVIMLASVFAAMVPTGSAAGDKREINLSAGGGIYTVLIGEKLRLYNIGSDTVSFVSTDPDHTFAWSVTGGEVIQDITSAKVKATGYTVTWDGVVNTIYFCTPSLSIKIVDATAEEITSTTIGKLIYLKVDTNLPPDDVVKLKAKKEAVETLATLNISDVEGYAISTAPWGVGDYEIWLELKEDKSRGLDKDECTCAKKTITVSEAEITITATKTKPVKFEEVTFTINGPPKEDFNFSTNKAEYVMMTRKEDNPLNLLEDEAARAMDTAGGKFKAQTDKNGVYKFVAYFTEDKKFTFDVWLGPSLDDATSKQKDDIDIDVSAALGVFDTGRPENTYPSIFGTHNGTITSYQEINASKLYTYPCPGTGGHTEHIKIWNNSNWNATANWHGYTGDWHNISFNEPFTLHAGVEYNYTIRTGSYPQIIHNHTHTTLDGSFINCTEFMDANGKRYDNWIPAIKLFT